MSYGRVTYGKGLSKVNDGLLPKQHSIKDLFGSRYLGEHEPAPDISIEGAHYRGRSQAGTVFDASEYLWYKQNKGYSK